MTPKHPSDYLWYLASPYSQYKDGPGLYWACQNACYASGLLIKNGIMVFSPIAHTHTIAEICLLPSDHQFWLRFDAAFVQVCDGLIVLKTHEWELSKGVAHEIKCFTEAHKPIFYMEPNKVPWTLQNFVKE
jgi:hypothetical protein